MHIVAIVVGAVLIYIPSAIWLAGVIGSRLREIEAQKGRSQFHFQYPSAPGSKLSVRVSSLPQSSSSDAG